MEVQADVAGEQIPTLGDVALCRSHHHKAGNKASANSNEAP